MRPKLLLLAVLVPLAATARVPPRSGATSPPEPASAAAQPSLNGTYAYDPRASDNVDEAIDTTVSRMSFLTRGIARGRLKKTNPLFQRLTIELGARDTTTISDGKPVTSPTNGTPIKWRREDGELFDVSTVSRPDELRQTFIAKDGERINTYSLSPDGQALTEEVAISSPRLPRPLVYRLVYRRVPDSMPE